MAEASTDDESGGTDEEGEEELESKEESLIPKDDAYMKYEKESKNSDVWRKKMNQMLMGMQTSTIPFWKTIVRSDTGNKIPYDTYTLLPGTKLFSGTVLSVRDAHILSRSNWFSDEDTAMKFAGEAVESNRQKSWDLARASRGEGKKIKNQPKGDFISKVMMYFVFKKITLLAVDSCRTVAYLKEMINSKCGKKTSDMVENAYKCPSDLSSVVLSYNRYRRYAFEDEKDLKSYRVPLRRGATSPDRMIGVCMCQMKDVAGHASLGFYQHGWMDQNIKKDSPFPPEIFICNPAEYLIPQSYLFL